MTNPSNKKIFYSIPDLCHCGCKEIVWGGKQYKSGHNGGRRGKITSEEHKQKISKTLIGKYYGINSHNYGKHLSKEIREKISNTLKKKPNGKNHPRYEIIVSIESRKKMSLARVGKYCGKNSPRYGISPSPSSGYGHGCYYDSPIQGRIWLRSSYELAYAQYLDSKNILWYYEIETFDLGDTTYTPDFFLPRYDKFIEVKGYMKKESQEKIDKFLEQYPFNLEILYREDLIKLGINLK